MKFWEELRTLGAKRCARVLTVAAGGVVGMRSSLRDSEGYGQRVHDPFLWEPEVWNYGLRQPQTSLSHKAPGCCTQLPLHNDHGG